MRFAEIARDKLEDRGGDGLEFRGDEVLAVFTSARQAIQAAVDLQTAFVEATIADPAFPLPVGIGLDAGEAVEVDDGYRGGALNLAARLCSIAGPGEILASREVVHLARRVDGVTQVDHGSVPLKGLAEPVRVTRIAREGWDPERDDAYQRALGRRAVPATGGFAVCPYRGLAAFQPDDADRFFGREDLVAELVQRLDHDRVLFVVGPSGSGKSSLVRAGLVPAIRSGGLVGSERWAVSLFTPRSDALGELTYQLQRLGDPTTLEEPEHRDRSRRVSGATGLRRLTDSVCDANGGLLMVIDQFEELFTQGRWGEQEAFVMALASIVDPADSRVRLVIAMRADFYGICATFPWLVRRVTANQVLVGPMSRADLRKAIEQPALAAGFRLEDGLADVVLEDAGTEPSALPLVSHAMAETWRRREGDTLTLAGYVGAGRVAGAIAQTADSLYETAFTDEEKEACRRLMLRLVTPGEGASDTRRAEALRDLQRDRDPEVLRSVAAEMTDARLLTVDRDSIELAHEALLESWPRLRRWIDAVRDDLRTRQRIGHATAEWASQGRDPDLLYRGTPLHVALEWSGEHGDMLGPQEQEFLEAGRDAMLREEARSEEAARRSRRVRRIAVSALAVFAAAAVAASLIAFSALNESRARYGQALATQARTLADSDPRTATAVAMEALVRGGTDLVDARAALVDASQTLADSKFLPSGPPVDVGDASTIVVSPDGSIVVTGNRDGSISTWTAAGANLAANVPGHDEAIEEMDITPDGRWLVSGSDDASVLLWDLADPADVPPPERLGVTSGIVWSVAVSPDGTTAASASEDGTILLWDLDAQRQLGSVWADVELDALTLAFSPDGELLLLGNGAGQVTGWTFDDRRVAIPTFHAHRSDVWEIEFSPDGSRFATASSDGRIRVWDTESQQMVAEPFARSADDTRGVLIDGDDVVAGDEDGRLLVASIDGAARPTVSAPGDAQIVDAAWGARTLATLGEDRHMQVWSRGGDPTAVVVDERISQAFALAASPDGRLLAIGDGEGNVHVVSTTTGEHTLGPIRLHDDLVWDLAFNGDGTDLASAGADGRLEVIDAASGERRSSLLPPSENAINDVLWAGDRLVAGGDDRIVRIWRDDAMEAELGPHDAAITAMAISPDGVLAVADDIGNVRLWNIDDGQEAAEPISTGEQNTIRGLAWSSNGATLATALDDYAVKLWDARTGEDVGTLGQTGAATSVAFLSDDATVVNTIDDGSVLLWDVATRSPLGRPLEGHEATSWRVVALPDMRFATSAEDGTVRIWDVLDADRACDRARGPHGLQALGAYLGPDEEPVACVES